jgi:hypothetical protein
VDRSVYAVQSAAMRVLAHEQDLNPTYHDAVDEPKQLWEIPDAAHAAGIDAHPPGVRTTDPRLLRRRAASRLLRPEGLGRRDVGG